jgi:hypothetical protein
VGVHVGPCSLAARRSLSRGRRSGGWIVEEVPDDDQVER